MTNPSLPVKIALFPYHSLGDGLVFLTIADNLHRSGFSITYFSHYIYQLKPWLPHLDIRPFPQKGEWENAIDEFQIVLMDAKCPYMRDIDPTEFPQLAKRFIYIAATRVDPRLIASHEEQLKPYLNQQYNTSFKHFASLAGPIQSTDQQKNIVDGAFSFCYDKLALNNAQRYPSFTVPKQLQHRKHLNRIIISPMSPNPNKNWSARGFIRLGKKLSQRGYEVIFVVAPCEHPQWSEIIKQHFPLPLFQSIEQLASYIYESGALISNDSGNGHLASVLNIPTVTLFKKNKNFPWRPGWGKGVVITPNFTFRLLGYRIWRPFVSTRKIIRAVEALTSDKTC